MQIVADAFGNVVCVSDRECSMQRRHQKVIEEAPCSYLLETTREKMRASGLCLAKHIKYQNVGTLEFLVDDDQNFYFLEMNTRLQVEHGVTEMVTGLDLVKLQIEVAQGLPLSSELSKGLKINGHAVECRIYAEDPANGFMPSPGTIALIDVPQGIGLRHDCGVKSGTDVSIYYDPMLSKIMAWAPTRSEAITRLELALNDFLVVGVTTNIDFLKKLLAHPDFVNEKMTTQFIDRNLELLASETEKISSVELEALSALSDKIIKGQRMTDNLESSESLWWRPFGDRK